MRTHLQMLVSFSQQLKFLGHLGLTCGMMVELLMYSTTLYRIVDIKITADYSKLRTQLKRCKEGHIQYEIDSYKLRTNIPSC